MFGTYFYHEILRKTVISFGTVFNDIHVRHQDNTGKDIVDTKVPIAYGPRQKFLARLQQQPDLNKAIAISLPRMSFEMSSVTYDPSRKSGITQTFKAKDGKKFKKVFMPVPYNIGFELNIITKLQDDSLQILEQILPFFQPGYTLTVDLVNSIGEKRDIPLILNGIDYTDDYEGNFDTRRALIYTLSFTAKTTLFGPISDVSGSVIKRTTVGYVAGSKAPGVSAERDLSYSTSARATKDYTGDVVTLIAENVDLIETVIEVDDGTKIEAEKYIYVGQEEMYVESVTGNKMTVRRGQDNSMEQNHVKGAQVKGINYPGTDDNALIQFGDDFGFDGEIS